MAGLWEPVGGVFWSAPPAVPDEGWAYWPAIAVLVVATIASLVVRQRIQAKRAQAIQEQEEWHLRQHITDIGAALTLVYMAIMVALTWGRIGALGSMPLNEVGDFLAGAFGPVAFLWLVLGFLQQGDELRMSTEALKDQATQLESSVQHQLALVEATKQQSEVELTKLQMQQEERDRALLANFTIRRGTSGTASQRGENMNRLTFRNDGSHAFDVSVELGEPFLRSEQLVLGDFSPSSAREYVCNLKPTAGPLKGEARLNYTDKNGNKRSEAFTYTVTESRADFKKIVPR